MGKRILLIGYNYAPEPTGIGKYSGEMMEWFAMNGYDCSVITAYPYYPYWKVQEPYYKHRFWYKTETTTFDGGGKLKVYRCPMYVPSEPSAVKRIMLDFSFLFFAFFQLLKLIPGKKFDFVMTVAPSFQFGLLGILYKKCRNAKLIYHTQDMQIEAARDLKMIKSKKIIDALFKVEKYIFSQSDVVSSISEEMVSKIKEKANKEVFLFPNWTNTKLFYAIENRDELKREFGFEPTDKIILYSGAIGEKQGLESILYAAEEFKVNKDLKFVICGSGPYKAKLQQMAKNLQLGNVIFLPLQPYEKFNRFLNIADVHLVIQKANTSDLVMPSKLTTILAVGGMPLITANKGSGIHKLIEKHHVGMLVNADDQQALNEGLKKSTLNGNEYLKKNARAYAESYLSIDNIMLNLESLLINLVKPVPQHFIKSDPLSPKVRVALVGAGRIGMSHLSILGAHPDVDLVGVCDKSQAAMNSLQKYSVFPCYPDFLTMLEETRPDAVFVAVPTKFHYSIIKELLKRNIHVFAEAPFCLTEDQVEELVWLATSRNMVNQVGYQHKFMGAFIEIKRIIENDGLGDIHHFTIQGLVNKNHEPSLMNYGESRDRLMDYGAHIIDLIQDLLAPVVAVEGNVIKSAFTEEEEDTIDALLELSNHATGLLSVSWNSHIHDNMSISLEIEGTKGKVIFNGKKLKIYFENDDCPSGYEKGWNEKYIAELTNQVNFYLKGEEYSAQIDYFIQTVLGIEPNHINTFESALITNKVLLLLNNALKVYDGKSFIWR